jgi:hypothetical protein
MIFESSFMRGLVKKGSDSTKIVYKSIPANIRYYNAMDIRKATDKIMTQNIRKAGFSVASMRYEKTDVDFDNATRKIKSGYVSYVLDVITADGQNRPVIAAVEIFDDKVQESIKHFSDNKGEKYTFDKNGLKSFLMGIEEPVNPNQQKSVFPSVGDGGSQSGQAAGAEPNLAFVHNNSSIMKLGHQSGSKILEANKKISGSAK